MDEVIIISQARLQSKRLDRKILKVIDSKSLLQIHLERLKKSKYSDNLIVATTYEDKIDIVLDILNKLNISFFQGSMEDVLDRFYHAAYKYNPSYVVRVTTDCPLIDPYLLDEVIDYALDRNLDYFSNTLVEAFPDGQDIEVIKWSALKYTWNNANSKYEREHVSPFIRKNSTFFGGKIFTSDNFNCKYNFNDVRMTVDQIEDFEAIKTLINKLGCNLDWLSYTNFIIDNPELFSNQIIIRNEGRKI
jgi:spore coat polysaccharide biosynthesis protein SpsF (cytidylyltransferase family)